MNNYIEVECECPAFQIIYLPSMTGYAPDGWKNCPKCQGTGLRLETEQEHSKRLANQIGKPSMSEEFQCVEHEEAYRKYLKELAKNYNPQDDADPMDIDISILTPEDIAALDALGDDLVDRLLKETR